MSPDWPRWVGDQDHVLIAIQDGEQVDEVLLRRLPPWRAALLADVAVSAGCFAPGRRDAIREEARVVGGAGRLSQAVAAGYKDEGTPQ